MPVSWEAGVNGSIAWYATEAEAKTAAAIVRENSEKYLSNRIYLRPCGRSLQYDQKTNGVKVAFAVTF